MLVNEKALTCTTSVHLGSANKFRVWIANGENKNIGSAINMTEPCQRVSFFFSFFCWWWWGEGGAEDGVLFSILIGLLLIRHKCKCGYKTNCAAGEV